MKVRELKQLLEKCPDDSKVVIIDQDSAWQTGRIEVTDVETEHNGLDVVIM